MKFKIRYADKIVGIFTITGILCIALLLIFMGINQRWFAKNYHFYTRFLSADGLRAGLPVKYRGFQIGQIRRVRLIDNQVIADFYIYDIYINIITPNTIIQKIVSPIGLGGSDIIIHPGPPSPEHIPENSFIPSFNIPEGRALIEAGLVDVSQAGNAIIDEAAAAISELTVLLNSINRTLEGEESISSGMIVRNIESLTTTLSQASSDIEGIIRNINVLSDDIANSHIDELLANLNQILIEVSDFTNFLNRSTPQLTGVLEEGRGALREGTAVMEGLRNNPLLRRGITQQREQVGTQHSLRREEF
ncbi:MAG: MlaD family protein [Spirochaetes bacterium]|nr:MlaD family protein [Spirochaetota bacterium]